MNCYNQMSFQLENNKDFLSIYDGIGFQKVMVNDLTGQLNFMSQIVHGNKMTAIFHTNFDGINAGFFAKLNYSIFI